MRVLPRTYVAIGGRMPLSMLPIIVQSCCVVPSSRDSMFCFRVNILSESQISALLGTSECRPSCKIRRQGSKQPNKMPKPKTRKQSQSSKSFEGLSLGTLWVGVRLRMRRASHITTTRRRVSMSCYFETSHLHTAGCNHFALCARQGILALFLISHVSV